MVPTGSRGDRSPGAEPLDEEHQKLVSLHQHILNLSTEGTDLPLVPLLNTIISTVAAPGVEGRDSHEILEAIESLLREQRPALYTERRPRRAGRRRGGPEVEENLRPRQRRRRREYARTRRAFRRNPQEVALDILGEGGPQGDDAPPVRRFFDEFIVFERPSGRQGGMRVVEEDAAQFTLLRQGAREPIPLVQTAAYTKCLGL